MAYLLFSPKLIDHSFPRSRQDLEDVVDALGQIQLLLAVQDCAIVATDFFLEFIEEFDWEKCCSTPLLVEIHRILLQILTRSGDTSFFVDTSNIENFELHPLPRSCVTSDCAAIWQEQAGKLLVIHEATKILGHDFIGIPCEQALAGRELDTYEPDATEPRFPLVDEEKIGHLASGDAWAVRQQDIQSEISFSLAFNNINVLGGRISSPPGGSHYKVAFDGARPWPLDRNVDPLPERFLAQLPEKCGYPIEVIKFVLLYGTMPPRVSLLADYLER